MRNRSLLCRLWVLLGLVLLGSTAVAALAQPVTPTFISEASYTFGQAMRFRLRAEDAPAVQAVVLYFRPQGSRTVYALDVPFSGENPVTAEQEVDLTAVNLPPYTLVTYWWRLETSAGEVLVPEQTVAYEDDRFDWQQMTQGGVTAHWTGQGPFFGQIVIDEATAALARLARVLPLEEIAPFDVYVYPSTADLRAALRLTQTTVDDRPHPELGVLLVTAVNPETAAADLAQVVPYELTHLLLYRVAGERYEFLPRWLREGLALTMQAETDPRYEQTLATAVVTQATVPLAQLCYNFPEDDARRLLAEAESAAFVRYLSSRYGAQTVSRLVEAYGDDAECQAGMAQVLGMTLDEVEQEWLATQRPRAPWVQFLVDNGLWFLLLGGSFGITGLLLWQTRRGAQRRK